MGSGWLLDWSRDYANKQCHKVRWWSIEKCSSYRADTVILANLAYSRAITYKCFMASGWLSYFAEIFCQQTFSRSVMIIQMKLLKLLSGQMLWTPPVARHTCSHYTSRFFLKRAYTNLSNNKWTTNWVYKGSIFRGKCPLHIWMRNVSCQPFCSTRNKIICLFQSVRHFQRFNLSSGTLSISWSHRRQR